VGSNVGQASRLPNQRLGAGGKANLPSASTKEGRRNARPTFMESPFSLLRMRWDLEPERIPLSRPSATLSPALGGGEGRERGSFMECLLDFCDLH